MEGHPGYTVKWQKKKKIIQNRINVVFYFGSEKALFSLEFLQVWILRAKRSWKTTQLMSGGVPNGVVGHERVSRLTLRQSERVHTDWVPGCQSALKREEPAAHCGTLHLEDASWWAGAVAPHQSVRLPCQPPTNRRPWASAEMALAVSFLLPMSGTQVESLARGFSPCQCYCWHVDNEPADGSLPCHLLSWVK